MMKKISKIYFLFHLSVKKIQVEGLIVYPKSFY